MLTLSPGGPPRRAIGYHIPQRSISRTTYSLAIRRFIVIESMKEMQTSGFAAKEDFNRVLISKDLSEIGYLQKVVERRF